MASVLATSTGGILSYGYASSKELIAQNLTSFQNYLFPSEKSIQSIIIDNKNQSKPTDDLDGSSSSNKSSYYLGNIHLPTALGVSISSRSYR